MPIYEFVCTPCNDKFEVLTSPSRISETKCPKCGSARVKRLMSTFYSRSSGGNSSHSRGSGCAGCSSTNCGSCGR